MKQLKNEEIENATLEIRIRRRTPEQIEKSRLRLVEKPTGNPYPEIRHIDDDDIAEYEEERFKTVEGNIIHCKIFAKENLKYALDTYCTPKKCKEFLNCQSSYINWYVKLPFFIIDNLMSKKKLSHSAFVIFLYLCRKANFNPSSNHFSCCWVNYKEICEVTGISVSNMRKYIVELEKKGMIKYTFLRKHDESGFKTIHEFTVFHIKLLHDKRKK